MSRDGVRMSRRSLLSGLALGAGAFSAQAILAGCAPKEPTAAPQKAAAAKATEAPAKPTAAPAKVKDPVELDFMTWWLPPLVIGDAVEKAVKQFNDDNSDINVTINPNPGGTSANLQKWQTLLAAGTPPDMTLMRPHYHMAFADRGALLAVDDLLSAEASVSKEDLMPQPLKRLTYDGKLWGLSGEVWFQFLFLNLDLFEEAGVEVPGWDWTWDDFLEIAAKLTKGEGASQQFGAAPMSGWWHSQAWAWGGEVLNAEENKCLADQEPTPTAIQWAADLALEHDVAPSPDDLAEMNSTALFETGRIGMFPMANWYLVEAMNKVKAKWGIAPMPNGPATRGVVVQGSNYAIFKLTKHVDEAWQLMVDMAVGEGQKLILRETGNFPATTTLAKPEFLPNYEQEWIDVSLESEKTARANHFCPKFVEWWAAARKELDQVWIGDKTAKEACEAMAPVIDGILQEE